MDSNKYSLYSGGNKMADVILRDYRLVTLLPRFDIQLGFGEKTLSEVCEKYGVNEAFFLLVCNIHTFDDYFPGRDELKGIDIDSMLKYLKQSHNYYIHNRIAAIERNLIKMSECSTEYRHHIISKFFAEYKQEVLNHFDYEERSVFPNIVALSKGENLDYHIDQYEENHDNINDKLSDLKNIIIKYLPEGCITPDSNDILIDIFLFEEDLEKHTRIEDKILIPFVKKIEGDYGK